MLPWKIAKTPEEAGLSSRMLLKYLDAVEASGLEHHSITVVRNGYLVCGLNYAPFRSDEPHVLFSLSKLFCSAAAGFAVEEGLLEWDSLVCDVLKDDLPETVSDTVKTITLEHLLTMSSGLDRRSDGFFPDHVVKNTLSFDCIYAPGTEFQYNSHGTYLISAMVQKVTGMNIRDYLIPRLFTPLGIPAPDWDMCPDGICMGGWGLHLSSESIARMGMCMAQNGMWQGKRVLPAEWLERASKARVSTANRPNVDNIDWKLGYSYQTWMCRGGRYRGDGAYGQICMVSPDKGMAVAVTAGIWDMGLECDLLDEYLFAAADTEPGTETEQKELSDRIAKLTLKWPEDDGAGKIPCGVFASDELSLTVTPDVEGVILTLKPKDQRSLTLKCGFAAPRPFTMLGWKPEAPSGPYLGACGRKGEVLSAAVRAADAPFVLKMRLEPSDGGLTAVFDSIGFPLSGKHELKKR